MGFLAYIFIFIKVSKVVVVIVKSWVMVILFVFLIFLIFLIMGCVQQVILFVYQVVVFVYLLFISYLNFLAGSAVVVEDVIKAIVVIIECCLFIKFDLFPFF